MAKLQETKLKAMTGFNEKSTIMPPAELKRFIQHYERITRHTLKHLPSSADIVIPINHDHSIKHFIKNRN